MDTAKYSLYKLVYHTCVILLNLWIIVKAQTIRCHDCAKEGCEEFIVRHPNRTGKCQVDLQDGKCFIRQDPNDRMYWGCIDDYFWPDVPWRSFNGCTEDWDRSWVHNDVRKPMIWCFCDRDVCNVSIDRLNQTSGGGGGGTGPTSKPTTPIDGKEGEDDCLNVIGPDRSCDHFCDVINGQIQCSCRDGYMLMSDGRTCRDIDEFALGHSACSDNCVNTPGSYFCVCDPGFSLGMDQHTCFDVNECLMNNGGCSDTCSNVIGSYICECPTGFVLLADGLSCQDINECVVNNGGCSHICTNTVGSFSCGCPTGYELMYDALQCQDINECVLQVDSCEWRCLNTQGSYTCSCNRGFSLQADGKSCQDMDECAMGLSNCVQSCVNTYGSYLCECGVGYTLSLDKQSCIDVNECLLPGQAGCEQICRNTEGSYMCGCHKGFRLHADGRSCIDDNECNENNGGCEQICSNLAGGVQCSCYEGYEPYDFTRCRDIDECAFNKGGCEQTCVNTPGSHECRCDLSDLFILAPDKHSCLTQCPPDFMQDYLGRACYLVVSPSVDEKHHALDYFQAEQACQAIHADSHLVSVNDEFEKEFLKRHLQQTSAMLEGWQGWWTSAQYRSGIGEFAWSPHNQLVDQDSPLWSFKKQPYEDTCIWIMQPSSYDYTWGNYECVTKSGYICEISLPEREEGYVSNSG